MYLLGKIKRIALHAHHLHESRLRVCHCCNQLSLIVSLSSGEESKICIRCRANHRYEMIATFLRTLNLKDKHVVEFDPKSPISHFFQHAAASYVRTYYSAENQKGHQREDGARCEDMTSLTFENDSIDILISSDVLEHIEDIQRAFQETQRVLKKGGMHIFTVPQFLVETLPSGRLNMTSYSGKTQRRAKIENKKIIHLLPPELHGDPLSEGGGILTFWNFGTDAVEFFSGLSALKIKAALGPEGKDHRVVFVAEKKEA